VYGHGVTQEQHGREVDRFQRELAWRTHQLNQLMKTWMAKSLPMSEDLDSPPPAWTLEDKKLTQQVANAWRDFMFHRWTYDGLLQSRRLLYGDSEPADDPGGASSSQPPQGQRTC
jgi:hypothetical protein